MPRPPDLDSTVANLLRTGAYDSLAIKRIDVDCFLLITAAGIPRVLAKPSGTAITFRHAWQVRDWLKAHFNITPDQIPVETYT